VLLHVLNVTQIKATNNISHLWELFIKTSKVIAHKALVAGQWFSLGTPVFSTNKTNRHDLAEILLKVALNTITLTLHTVRNDLTNLSLASGTSWSSILHVAVFKSVCTELYGDGASGRRLCIMFDVSTFL